MAYIKKARYDRNMTILWNKLERLLLTRYKWG